MRDILTVMKFTIKDMVKIFYNIYFNNFIINCNWV